jgi:hypothetical protein
MSHEADSRWPTLRAEVKPGLTDLRHVSIPERDQGQLRALILTIRSGTRLVVYRDTPFAMDREGHFASGTRSPIIAMIQGSDTWW